MVMMKDLCSQYGAAVAKSLRDDKKKQEQQKSPTDSIVYWSEHPDLPGKEDWTEDEPLKIGWGTKMFIESIYEIIYICILHNVNIKIYIQIVSNYIPYIPH